ncbi:hypothetical protein DL93DRAFT_2065458 [Clavulina sp. PMI_390]|nr:hypothetical protein DL93DRAFT_2065458 [Clavulina sp. PMI_390]
MQIQPYGTPMMSVRPPGGNRNALDLPFDKDGRRQWSIGLKGAHGHCGECCYSCLCPCMEYAKIHSRLRHLEAYGTPHPQGGEAVTLDCCIYALFCHFGLQVIPNIGLRRDARERYRISGSFLKDVFFSCFCSANVLTQTSHEMRLEEWSIDSKGPQP